MIVVARSRESFLYDPKTGYLHWRVANSNRVKVGDRAGSYDRTAGRGSGSGYIRIFIDGKFYYAHRVILQMNNIDIPAGMQVDHIDHNRANNRLENLRVVTHQRNAQNISMPADNISGVIGVGWSKASSKHIAYITIGGRRFHLGVFAEFEDAVAARKQAEIKHGFCENHGNGRHS
jgi:hypothetical protein